MSHPPYSGTPRADIPWHFRFAAVFGFAVASLFLGLASAFALFAGLVAPTAASPGPFLIAAFSGGASIIFFVLFLIWTVVAICMWRGHRWAAVATVLLHLIQIVLLEIPGSILSGSASVADYGLALFAMLSIYAVVMGTMQTRRLRNAPMRTPMPPFPPLIAPPSAPSTVSTGAPPLDAPSVAPNPVVYFEIPVSDMARAKAFYERVFLTRLEPTEIDGNEMALFPSAQGGAGASGALARGESYQPGTAGARIYFSVASVESTLERALMHGGRLNYPPTFVAGYGWVAECIDTEGNCIALFAAARASRE